jgi:hypothetical protein
VRKVPRRLPLWAKRCIMPDAISLPGIHGRAKNYSFAGCHRVPLK